nr:hypothetical protein [Candidatus Dependentiae bacterium]
MNSHNQPSESVKRLEVTQHQVSYVTAFGIISSFFIFMAGYYSGKKYVLENAHQSVMTDSFSDIVYHAFYSLQEAFVPYNEQQISSLNAPNKGELIDTMVGKKKMGEEKLYYAEV